VSEATSSRNQVSALRWVRWLLVVPSAFVGWYIGVIVPILIFKANEALCPTHYLVSGMCHSPWSAWIEGVAIIIGSVLAGALVVLLPALIAPTHRKPVALIAYVIGLACSLFVLILMLDLWYAVVSAAVAGGVSLWRVHRARASPSYWKGAT